MAHTAHTMADWTGYMTHAEIEFLTKLASELKSSGDKPLHVINIGSGSGTSGLAIRAARPTDHMTTIDIQYESSPFGCIEGELNALQEAGLADRYYYHFIVGDSKQVAREWTRGPVNMVFVDGDHTYEGCAGDITGWMEHLVPGGVIAIHDYKKAVTNKPYFGVDRAVDELMVGRFIHMGTVDSLIAFRKEVETKEQVEDDQAVHETKSGGLRGRGKRNTARR